MNNLTTVEIAKAGWSRIQVLRMLVKGVAFRKEAMHGMHWVFSHEGDHLGDIPTIEVHSAIAYVKRMRESQGRKFEVGKVKHNNGDPGLTLAWQGYPNFREWVPVAVRFPGSPLPSV